jgi:hypothetical protein
MFGPLQVQISVSVNDRFACRVKPSVNHLPLHTPIFTLTLFIGHILEFTFACMLCVHIFLKIYLHNVLCTVSLCKCIQTCNIRILLQL